MNNESKNELNRSAVTEIEETELEAIADGLPVHSGVKAGRNVTPCI